MKTITERFYSKVRHELGCWIWMGSIDPSGYGRFGVKGEVCKAHRVSYELFNGPIPKGVGAHGTCVIHKCDNRACVNPAHLLLGDQNFNLKDMVSKGRQAKGSRNGMAILSEKQVRVIKRCKSLRVKQKFLGNVFATTQSTIGRIYNGNLWQHVKTDDIVTVSALI